MRRLSISLVLIAVLLTACSSEAGDSAPEPTPTPAPLAPSGSSEEAYHHEVAEIVADLSASVEDFTVRVETEDLSTGQSLENIGAAIIAWQDGTESLRALSAPDTYQDIQAQLLEGADQLDAAAAAAEQWLADSDANAIDSAVQQAQAAITTLQTALAAISA
jgi:hypothetical protein